MSEAIDFESTLYKVLYTCLSLLVLKVFFMVPLIGRYRYSKKIVISPEDTKLLRGLKVKDDDPDIERVRRAHRNDLENIPIFISLAFLYSGLKPNPLIAIPLFIIYTLARFAHTYVYAVTVVKQPARVISFTVGALITAYMGVYIILSTKDFM